MSHNLEQVLYIHFEDALNPNKSGVINKINGQVEALKKLGFFSQIVSFRTKNKLFLDDTCLLTIPSRILLFRYLIFRKLRHVVARKNFAFIYIRYFGSDHAFLVFLKWLQLNKIRVFLEFPTFPYDKELKAKNLVESFIVLIDKYYRNKISKYVHRAVSFTYDGNILNMPTLKLENGISLQKVLLTPRSSDKSSLHMIGVANVSPWHGYDRIIQGIYEFRKKQLNAINVTFTIVGSGNSLPELKQLCHELHLEGHVIFAGPKAGAELDEEFKKAHLAIGSLGMHRIGLLKGSVLKLGEYIARGFPAVIAYDDYSIVGEIPFVLKIPADDSPADIGLIVEFYNSITISQEHIREYAALNFSWDKKMERIIASL